jgi:hypothetical protein
VSEPAIARVITLRYQNSLRELLRFRFYHQAHSPVAVGFIALWVAAVSFVFYRTIPDVDGTATRILTVFLADCIAFAALMALVALVYVLDLMSPRNKTVLTEHRLALDQDSLTHESQYGRSEMKWTIVQRLVRTKKCLFLYIIQNTAFLVPRRAFRDDAEWEAFYEYCKQRSQPA